MVVAANFQRVLSAAGHKNWAVNCDWHHVCLAPLDVCTPAYGAECTPLYLLQQHIKFGSHAIDLHADPGEGSHSIRMQAFAVVKSRHAMQKADLCSLAGSCIV